jgi:hypothetical protein
LCYKEAYTVVQNPNIGVYTSEELAKEAMKKCIQQDEYEGNEDREYTIDEIEVNKQIRFRKYMIFKFKYNPPDKSFNFIWWDRSESIYIENPVLSYIGNDTDGGKLTISLTKEFYEKEVNSFDPSITLERLEFLAAEYYKKLKS